MKNRCVISMCVILCKYELLIQVCLGLDFKLCVISKYLLINYTALKHIKTHFVTVQLLLTVHNFFNMIFRSNNIAA